MRKEKIEENESKERKKSGKVREEEKMRKKKERKERREEEKERRKCVGIFLSFRFPDPTRALTFNDIQRHAMCI